MGYAQMVFVITDFYLKKIFTSFLDEKRNKKYSWVIIVFWYSWIFDFKPLYFYPKNHRTHFRIATSVARGSHSTRGCMFLFDSHGMQLCLRGIHANNSRAFLNIFIPKIIGRIFLSWPQPLVLRTRLRGHSLRPTLKSLPWFSGLATIRASKNGSLVIFCYVLSSQVEIARRAGFFNYPRYKRSVLSF